MILIAKLLFFLDLQSKRFQLLKTKERQTRNIPSILPLTKRIFFTRPIFVILIILVIFAPIIKSKSQEETDDRYTTT